MSKKYEPVCLHPTTTEVKRGAKLLVVCTVCHSVLRQTYSDWF
jgi:hypothetical protein